MGTKIGAGALGWGPLSDPDCKADLTAIVLIFGLGLCLVNDFVAMSARASADTSFCVALRLAKRGPEKFDTVVVKLLF